MEQEEILAQIRSYEEVYSHLNEDQIQQYQTLIDKYRQCNTIQEQRIATARNIKWKKLGHRATKFFLNKQNQRSKQGKIKYLKIDNEITFDKQEIDTQIKQHFQQTFGHKTNTLSIQQMNVPELQNIISEKDKLFLNQDITNIETTHALQKGKLTSSGGHDQTTYQLLNWIESQTLGLIIQCHNKMFTHGDLKAQTMLIKLIPKSNKDNYDTLDKYRPINLSNLISRSLSYIINQRLMTVLKNYPILTGLNFAYQQGKSKHDMVQQIKDSLSIAKANNMEDFTILNLDLKAAFDSPNKSYKQETCTYIGFPNKLTNYFDLLHKKTNAIILDTNLDPIPIQSGVFQNQSEVYDLGDQVTG